MSELEKLIQRLERERVTTNRPAIYDAVLYLLRQQLGA